MTHKPIIAITGITGTLGRAVERCILEENIERAPPDDWIHIYGCSRRGGENASGVDVRHEGAVRQWFADLSECGDLYALVTCAGIAAVSPLPEQDLVEFQAVMETNVNGTWLCIREAVRHGVRRIVTVSSILGGFPMGYPDRAAYIASKAAVVGLTRALAVELAPKGIAINCVVPGHYTLMASKAKGLLEGALAKQPAGRLVTPEEVARVIAWLVLDAPESLTGVVLSVDGGYSLNQWPVR